VVQADPADAGLKLLAAQEALRGGMLDKGLEMLKGVDDSSIKDPEVFYNVAALLLKRPEAGGGDPVPQQGGHRRPGLRGWLLPAGARLPWAPEDRRGEGRFPEGDRARPTGAQAETAKKALQQLK